MDASGVVDKLHASLIIFSNSNHVFSHLFLISWFLANGSAPSLCDKLEFPGMVLFDMISERILAGSSGDYFMVQH
jgi:hypothetical protein